MVDAQWVKVQEHQLVCSLCREVLCEALPGATLEEMQLAARKHQCRSKSSRKPWKHSGHLEVQHRDRKPPWCNGCGWAAPVPKQPARKLGEGRG